MSDQRWSPASGQREAPLETHLTFFLSSRFGPGRLSNSSPRDRLPSRSRPRFFRQLKLGRAERSALHLTARRACQGTARRPPLHTGNIGVLMLRCLYRIISNLVRLPRFQRQLVMQYGQQQEVHRHRARTCVRVTGSLAEQYNRKTFNCPNVSTIAAKACC